MERSIGQMLSVLRQFEGRRCLWRLPVAGLALIASTVLPFAGSVAGAYLAADREQVGLVILSAIFAVGSGMVGSTVWRRRPWRTVFAKRLWTYERPHAGPIVPVLVQECDLERAVAAVRRSRLKPEGVLRIYAPPADARDLNTQINVMEPADWQLAASDEALLQRVVGVFRGSRIIARVAGIDVRPVSSQTSAGDVEPSPSLGH